MILALKDVSCGYGEKNVVNRVSFSLSKGQALCLFGPNGAGKSTLFKAVLGLIPCREGEISLNGMPLERFTPGERARHLGYVPQTRQAAFPFTVEEVVLMGRISRMGRFAGPGREDRKAAAAALEEMGIASLAGRIYTRLSGGEQQAVLLARALAQDTEFLIMDEPLSHLDYGRQTDMISRVIRLKGKGKGILFTTHSPNHVLQSGADTVIIREGEILARGGADEVISPDNLKKLYGMDTEVKEGSGHTPPYCVPRISLPQKEEL